MKRLFIISFTLLFVHNISAQKKDITLEDIWKKGTFRAGAVYGLTSMNDGLHYSTLDNGGIMQYEYAKASAPVAIVSAADLKYKDKQIEIGNYSFSADESKVLIATDI